MARRSALALVNLVETRVPLSAILTPHALENAMLLHAAFGGSTNLLLHIPALAHAAGLRRPTVDDWHRVNRQTPRLVDALPNGPRNHPTVQVFMAGGVPEVMLHLRRMGLLHLDVLTVTGETLGSMLDWWEGSERRRETRARLRGVRRRRSGSGDHERRRRATARPGQHGGLPGGQHRARGIRDQGDRHLPVGGRRRRGLPASWTGARLRVRDRRDRGDQGHQRRAGRSRTT